MAVKVAINGFGRIGRLALRRIMEMNTDLEVVAINDLTDNDDLAYLLKYDTAQGRFPWSVDVDGDDLVVDGKNIKSYEEKDAANLPWGDLGVDIVLECTGFYTSKEASQAHIDAGAKYVLISAPAKGDVKTVVYGVNHDVITADDQIVSAASCTTNCLAPMVNALNKEFGIKSAVMTTVHAYTATQKLQDSPGGRKNRAAANIIPASTGAAKAIGKVIPELDGKIDGAALRVPTITGSLTQVYAVLDKSVAGAEEVNEAVKKYASDAFVYNTDEIVSGDIIGYPAGSVYDATLTNVMGEGDDQIVQVNSWYDNEYGFVANMVQTLEHFAGLVK
ncbi:type I glyceraldehyde-3-phosphate dehydrogenase [Aerococcaceae bacterium DSM 111022]|nr:type I glyceraldehyde-3-phosphate dehydrogenase [Aerococcaceae bacterium DSM 111022]